MLPALILALAALGIALLRLWAYRAIITNSHNPVDNG